jgi:hypothetical protein
MIVLLGKVHRKSQLEVWKSQLTWHWSVVVEDVQHVSRRRSG